jgi:hypothetical protein
LTVTASATQLTLVFTAVVGSQRQVREQIIVNLTRHQIA